VWPATVLPRDCDLTWSPSSASRSGSPWNSFSGRSGRFFRYLTAGSIGEGNWYRSRSQQLDFVYTLYMLKYRCRSEIAHLT
jgi:hypothetical protein